MLSEERRIMNFKFLFSVFFCTVFVSVNAQETEIDTVFIFDKQLEDGRKTQQIYHLKNSDLKKNATNLSETLRFQTPIYIKENGRGAVSSPSFRGTTAQQTAFVWNGINVNSIFLGQGDINNLALLTNDEIVVKSGGGSVEYGTAAIGGTVHMNDIIAFNKGFKTSFFAEYGSFNTINSSLKSSYSNDQFSIKFNGGFSKSNNDYEVEPADYINRNGEYDNQSFNIGAGYRFNENHQIFLQTQQFFSEQHYPIFFESQTKTKYKAETFRSLLSWKMKQEKFKNLLSLAYLSEEFSYFGNIENSNSTGSLGKIFLLKNDFDFHMSQNLKLNIIGQIQEDEGEGKGNGIGNPKRTSASFAALLKYDLNENWYLEGGAKKEFIENIDVPLLYSIGGNFHPNSWYELKFKGSKNFRAPTFNDLYWQPGGNIDLQPEMSYQGEITNIFKFQNFKISFTPYYNYIENMIRWLPSSQGLWSPINTNKVEILGIESQIQYSQKFGEHSVGGNVGYSLTRSQNLETGFQLNYVPMHNAFGGFNYAYQSFSVFFQGLFNGRTFPSTDETQAFDPYFVLNGGFNYAFFEHYQLGFKVNNITDTFYETMDYYPLPMRNYMVNLNINF